MSKSITQDMAYRQFLMKYAEKYGAIWKYNIRFRIQRWDGSTASLGYRLLWTVFQSSSLPNMFDNPTVIPRFQSTRPLRGATIRVRLFSAGVGISTHAPLAERDDSPSWLLLLPLQKPYLLFRFIR